jgi:uncharacterized protein (TIGR03032 family)
MSAAITSTGDSAPPYAFEASPGLSAWLHAENIALAISTYQIGKLFLVGAPTPDRLSVTERTFERCLGIAVDGASLYLAGLNNILRFDNVVPAGQALEGHDAVYVPQVAWYTGDVFAHDIGVLPSGRPVFINTLFGCLATVDEASSFRPVWQPPFLSALRPEDRCHLNGLAMQNGRPRFVTAAARTDTARGWREQRVGGGLVLDVASSEVVATGLSMPHSPRLDKGRLYLCNAGTGELGEIEPDSGRFNPIAFCPGFARGLALHGGYALVGLSLPRQHRDFSGLPLDDRLKQAGREPECVVQAIDLARGEAVHWLRIGGVVRELYDIAVIPGVRIPMVVGFAQGQINRLISRGRQAELGELLREVRA